MAMRTGIRVNTKEAVKHDIHPAKSHSCFHQKLIYVSHLSSEDVWNRASTSNLDRLNQLYSQVDCPSEDDHGSSMRRKRIVIL